MFSLVIPTFNRADLIGETIDNALSQTMPFSEILIVDDGSTDHTAQTLAGYGERIKVISTKNQGVQAARNVGVAAAQGEYVTLCDSDDLLENSFLEVVSSWLSLRSDIDIAYVNFRTFTEATIGVDKFSQAPAGWLEGAQCERTARGGQFCCAIPDLYNRTIVFQPLFPTGQTFRKSFYQSIAGYDTRFNGVGGEDWEFTLRAIAAGKVGLCMEPLSRVRKHAGNDSANLVRQLLGESAILDFAAGHHGAVADACAEQIKASIDQRRLSAFNHAYASGDFNSATEISAMLPIDRRGLKFRAKTSIMRLPKLLRKPLWTLTQG